MSNKDKATERPAVKLPLRASGGQILETGALVIAEVKWPAWADSPEEAFRVQAERAALIVRAVNSHEPLCKALERAWDMLNQARAVARLQGCNALNGPEVAEVIENARAELKTVGWEG